MFPHPMHKLGTLAAPQMIASFPFLALPTSPSDHANASAPQLCPVFAAHQCTPLAKRPSFCDRVEWAVRGGRFRETMVLWDEQVQQYMDSYAELLRALEEGGAAPHPRCWAAMKAARCAASFMRCSPVSTAEAAAHSACQSQCSELVALRCPGVALVDGGSEDNDAQGHGGGGGDEDASYAATHGGLHCDNAPNTNCCDGEQRCFSADVRTCTRYDEPSGHPAVPPPSPPPSALRPMAIHLEVADANTALLDAIRDSLVVAAADGDMTGHVGVGQKDVVVEAISAGEVIASLAPPAVPVRHLHAVQRRLVEAISAPLPAWRSPSATFFDAVGTAVVAARVEFPTCPDACCSWCTAGAKADAGGVGGGDRRGRDDGEGGNGGGGWRARCAWVDGACSGCIACSLPPPPPPPPPPMMIILQLAARDNSGDRGDAQAVQAAQVAQPDAVTAGGTADTIARQIEARVAAAPSLRLRHMHVSVGTTATSTISSASSASSSAPAITAGSAAATVISEISEIILANASIEPPPRQLPTVQQNLAAALLEPSRATAFLRGLGLAEVVSARRLSALSRRLLRMVRRLSASVASQVRVGRRVCRVRRLHGAAAAAARDGHRARH